MGPYRESRLSGRYGKSQAAPWVLALLLAACAHGGGELTQVSTAEAQSGMGELTGTVVLWPVTPAERPGMPSTAPAPGVRIVVSGPDGREVRSMLTDAAGLYRTSLPPATYQVTIPQLPIPQHTKDLPAEVTITAGQERRLDIKIDTGLRAR
jgi:hypothetical protein